MRLRRVHTRSARPWGAMLAALLTTGSIIAASGAVVALEGAVATPAGAAGTVSTCSGPDGLGYWQVAVRRRSLCLRHCAVLRLDGRRTISTSPSSAWRRASTVEAIGWWPPTAECSALVTLPSRVPPAPSI